MTVLIYHVTIEIPKIFDPITKFYVGAAGVDLFFVVSGFVMIYVAEPLFGKGRESSKFLLRRIARIAPLYWLTSSFVLIQLAYLWTRTGSLEFVDASIESIIASFFFFPSTRPSGEIGTFYVVGWTLNYEMFFYVVLSLLLVLSRSKAIISLAIIFIVLACVNLMLAEILPAPLKVWSDPIILEFLYGVFIGVAFRAGIRISPTSALVLIVAGVAALVWVQFHAGALPRCVEFGIPAATIAMAATLLQWPRGVYALLKWPIKWMSVLGDASYSLYLVHLHMFFIVRLAYREPISPYIGPWGYAAALIISSIVAALVVYWSFDRPVTQYLSRRLSKLFSEHPPQRTAIVQAG